jgi:hypothetical protein
MDSNSEGEKQERRRDRSEERKPRMANDWAAWEREKARL